MTNHGELGSFIPGSENSENITGGDLSMPSRNEVGSPEWTANTFGLLEEIKKGRAAVEARKMQNFKQEFIPKEKKQVKV